MSAGSVELLQEITTVEHFDETEMREPLGSLTKEQKKDAEKKVVFRCVNGSWLPEYSGAAITARDINNITKCLKLGYSRYKRLFNLRQRFNDSQNANKE